MKKDILVPAAGESVKEADIVTWYKKTGDYVEMDEPLVELETEKATLSVPASCSGTLTVAVSEGTVNVGAVIGSIEEGKTTAKKTVEKAEKSEPETTSPIPATSPAAGKLIRENNLDTAQIPATGKDGRVTKQDVVTSLSKETTKSIEPAPSTATKQSETTAPSAPSSRPVRVEKMSRLRRTLATRLVQARQEMALTTTFNEINMKRVMKLRQTYKEDFKKAYQVNLGFMSFFTTAVCAALKAFPVLNARIEGDTIYYQNFYDIGIAVAAPKGLVVPVIRNADKLSFSEIESKISELAGKAREAKLGPDDLSGGTFSITNGGIFGSLLSTPIVNYPQSAILGLHNITERPIAVNGQVEICPMMYAAITYDHRLIDGADAVKFLFRVKELIENPERLIIGV